MRSVTIGRILGMLASAPGHFTRFAYFDNLRRKAAAFVGTVAKRLALRLAAGTPGIAAGFNVLNIWSFLRDFGICHKNLLLSKVPTVSFRANALTKTFGTPAL